MARHWYAYNGIGDPLLPGSYNLAFTKPSCITGNNLCAIYSLGATNPTSLSTHLRIYIADGFTTWLSQPNDINIPNQFKKYVYMKFQ